MNASNFPAGTVGYIYRIDCANPEAAKHGVGDWSYFGQSARLDAEDVKAYNGSGFFMRGYLGRYGTEGLSKSIVATATSATELHYLEMLTLAEARKDGVRVANGDWGGPQAFSSVQRFFREEFAEELPAGTFDRELFFKLIKENRARVELVIERAATISTDAFYEDLERTLRATQNTSVPCPSCGAMAGELCFTNAKNPEKPQNPSANHSARNKLLR